MTNNLLIKPLVSEYKLIDQYYSDGFRITEFLLDGTLNVTMIPWRPIIWSQKPTGIAAKEITKLITLMESKRKSDPIVVG
jgi:hypothetical protein